MQAIAAESSVDRPTPHGMRSFLALTTAKRTPRARIVLTS
jgi:hypothetical protein